MIEDKLLIWKFKCGDSIALQRIYEKYRNDLLKLAVFLANDVNTAEDVVHDIFVSFAQSAAKISPDGNLKRYLIAAVANRVRNLRRDRQRHPASSIDKANDLVSDSAGPQRWAILSEQLALLSNAMAQIPYEQREVISLYMQSDMTFRQIAKLQDVSINTVQGRYRYGMEKLRTLLNSEMQE